MNARMIVYIIGKMLGVEAAVLMVPALVGTFYGEEDARYFVITAAILFWIYAITGRKKPERSTIYGKEGLFVVASAWVLWSLFGAFPLFMSGTVPNYIDAFFETVSGFTTTGSTILRDIEALPKCMNFWRALTHWIGGMGVLVFVMMLTSLEDKHSMHLIRAEVPGPEAAKILPRARQSAKVLYLMYTVMTVILFILLCFGDMNIFDSLLHALSTAGTGGISNYTASVGVFNSVYIDGVITVFMVLFAVNFDIYFLLIMGKVKEALKNEELRAYLLVIAVTVGVITINVLSVYKEPLKAFRYAAFQVSSVISTTGFATADYNVWPELSKCILIMLMMVGSCAGSTGGGMKISRWLILLKSIRCEIKQVLHPKSVNIVKINGKRIGQSTMQSVYVYFIAYIIILMGSVLIVSIDNWDFSTTFTSVLTTLSNVGPGMNHVGPVEHFADFSPLSKIVLCIDMLVGRLEIFPFLMLFSPIMWKRKF